MTLNANPADLLATATTYEALATRAESISPRAVEEVQAIIATHGVMGYPTAVGILTALAPKEARVVAKTAQFHAAGRRFTEHAATYRGQDAAGADEFASVTVPTVV